MMRPPTRYARSGDARIAYQVVGEGPVNLIVVGGPASHVDLEWEHPDVVAGIERVASFSRLVRFDRRGTGLSDPMDRPPTLEQQMDDLCAVMDAVGLESTALLGAFDGGLCAMCAATHPHRVTALVLVGLPPAAAGIMTDERREELMDVIENHWGEDLMMPMWAPSRIGDRRFEEWWGRYLRASASPGQARKMIELFFQMDLRGILGSIRVPTLVVHRTGDPVIPLELGRETAALIPGARFVELPGSDAFEWADSAHWTDVIEEFLTGRRRPREPERVLATVLFTDIVGSTGRAAEVGDHAWRGLLDKHDQLVRQQLESWRGREVKSLGDGFLAVFDGPARAVNCARAIVGGLAELGVEVRAGLHTGECEVSGDDVRGIAVHIGARITDLARGGEILVSSTVKDLVVGSGLRFMDRDVHALRGVPGEWRVYAVEP